MGDRNAEIVDGLDFKLGEGTDLVASCATSFKGNMYIFGGYYINDQVSIINNCALEKVATMPFPLQKGACQARLDDQVLLCFSDHESDDDQSYEDNPGNKK